MRIVGLIFLLLAWASAVELRTNIKRAADTPSWAKAVTDAQAALDARNSAVSKLTGQCAAALGTETAKKSAYEEAQRNVVSQKVVVAQATAHVNTATTVRDQAKNTYTTFNTGPYAQAAATWKIQSAKKPDLDARQKKISASQNDIQTDFPAEARIRATQDLNAAQTALTAEVTTFNNANLAYNAAKLTLAGYLSSLNSAQNVLDAKNAELTAAKATLAKLRAARDQRLSELKAATSARQTCDQQLTQAKQEVVAAVGHLRTALENQIRVLREQHFAAQQLENSRKADVKTQEDTKQRLKKQVDDLTAEIARVTARYNDAQSKLSKAIADYTVAQTNYDNAKARTVMAKQHVAQATADYKKFSAAHPAPPPPPSPPASPPTVPTPPKTSTTTTTTGAASTPKKLL